MSRLTDAIVKKKQLIGTLVSVSSPSLAEALSFSGLDWLFFDLEHSVMSLADVQAMIQAMNPDCLSMVRIEDPQTVYAKRALDTGCDALIVPQVNSADIARAIVKAGKFPPAGERSVGLGRALGYGTTLAQGVKVENSRTSLIMQIEHTNAVEHVDEILKLEEVEAVFVGPYDLSGSFGIPGEIGNSRVQDAISSTLKSARSASKPAGIFVGSAEAARKELARGFQIVAVSSDLATLAGSMRTICGEIRRG